MRQKKLPINGPCNGQPVPVPFPFNTRSTSLQSPCAFRSIFMPVSIREYPFRVPLREIPNARYTHRASGKTLFLSDIEIARERKTESGRRPWFLTSIRSEGLCFTTPKATVHQLLRNCWKPKVSRSVEEVSVTFWCVWSRREISAGALAVEGHQSRWTMRIYERTAVEKTGCIRSKRNVTGWNGTPAICNPFKNRLIPVRFPFNTRSFTVF